jgi:carbon-monoxide dehydrogenase medium subunit
MIPAPFEYVAPTTLAEAMKALSQHGDRAKLLAGGHSLIPAMKLRLARPEVVIDLGRIRELAYIRRDGDRLAIGALTTHVAIETSNVVRDACPLLAVTAPQIGDPQVRNKGTIGGSVAHADPAADWPAAMLALDAELVIEGPSGRRTVKAGDFFVDVFQTALTSSEILCEVRVPVTGPGVAYVKTVQKASGFAVTGVAAVVEAGRVRVGVTGVAAKPNRATGVEQAIGGERLTADLIAKASARAADGIQALNDIHASAEYRAHLARTNAARALTAASKRTA